MEDIAPKLYEKITIDFDQRLKKDKQVEETLKRIKEERAELADVSLYARRLGELASDTLIECIDEEELPNGILYWNIAEKTILPLIRRVHKMVNDAAIEVQKYEDRKNGMGINSVSGKFPEERAKALVQKIVDLSIKEAE